MIGFLTITGFAAPVGRKGDGPLFEAAEGLAGTLDGPLTGVAFTAGAFVGVVFPPDTFADDLGIVLGGATFAACFAGAAFAGGFFAVGVFLAEPVFAGRGAGFADFVDFVTGRDLGAPDFLATVFALAGFFTAPRDFAAGFARFFTGVFIGAGRFFFATGCFFFLGEGCFFCAMVIAGL